MPLTRARVVVVEVNNVFEEFAFASSSTKGVGHEQVEVSTQLASRKATRRATVKVEYEADVVPAHACEVKTPPKRQRHARGVGKGEAQQQEPAGGVPDEPSAKVVVKAAASSMTINPPELWEQQLAHIQAMRAAKNAPVDTMGCEAVSLTQYPPEVRRFHVLVAALLSSQTKDEVTYAAVLRLQAHSGLTVSSVLDTEVDVLQKLLHPVGFYNRKAANLKGITAIMRDKYDGDIPPDMAGLMALPGIGPKMAHLIMTVAWGKVEGICVDTHVHRIANRLNWVGPNGTTTPEATRLALQAWLPQSLWAEINPLLVGFGQTICTPRSTKCSECLANALCPAAFQNSPSPKKRRSSGS